MSEDWLTSAETYALVAPALSPSTLTPITIASRAYDGLIRTKAERLITEKFSRKTVEEDMELPARFWWAKGHAALDQNWVTGDFSTWINNNECLRAYGVQFLRADIFKMLPPSSLPATPRQDTPVTKSAVKTGGGRPLSKLWPDWVAELASYIHEEGIPDGVGSQGQEDLIQAIADRLAIRGLEAPSRSTLLPTVQAILLRLRHDDN